MMLKNDRGYTFGSLVLEAPTSMDLNMQTRQIAKILIDLQIYF